MVTKITSLSFCFALILLSVESSFAQQRQSTYNLHYFSKQQKPPAAELAKATPANFKNHPDYGVLPVNAPCSDCVELIDKRTSNMRKFQAKDNKGALVYEQKSLGNLNYKDANGLWRDVNPHLSPDANNPKIFSAMKQISPVVINMEEKYASIKYGKKEFRFNKNLQLSHVDENGKETSLGIPDWSHFTAGDEGVTIKDFYPGIDAEFIVFRGEVETNFILNHRLPFSGGYMVLKEDVDMPEGLVFNLEGTTLHENGQRSGKFNVTDKTGKTYFEISNGVAYDASGNESAFANLTSKIDGSAMHFYLPVNWLNDSKTVYPVVIDPWVQAPESLITSDTLAQGLMVGSGYSAACPPLVVGPGCPYNLQVWTPSYCTIIDVLYSLNYQAVAPNQLMQGGFSIEYDNGAGCTAQSPPGGANTCPIPVPGMCARQNQTMFSDIVGCLPPPQCDSFAMDFTLHFYRCVGAPVGCSQIEIRVATDWIMTIIGRPLHLDVLTPDINICLGACADLWAEGSYGVAPYGFRWVPGGGLDSSSGNHSFVNVCPAVTTQYLCIMTDDCTFPGGSASIPSGYHDDSLKVWVNVGNNNNPGFTWLPLSPCENENVLFTGNAGGVAADYNWEIPGTGQTFPGTISFNTAFTTAGTYDVILHFGTVPCVADDTLSITVQPSVVPFVTNTPSPPFPVCPGTCVTFTAVPTNGGPTPAYQWQVNGGPVGTNSDTYTNCALADGDIINVILTSSETCPVPDTASASVLAVILPPAAPTIDVTAFPAWPICFGDMVTFTTVITYPGTAPVYQWYLNGGLIAGATDSFYTTTTLNNGDIISCTFTSNDPCAIPPDASDQEVAVVNLITNPTVIITQIPGWPICDGTPVQFTAIPTDAGTPTYQWYLGGILVAGATNSTYTNSTLLNGDVISVEIFSSEPCPVPPNATDDEIAVVLPNVVPTVVITPNPVRICAGTPVTFTATATNGGIPPAFAWTVNGVSDGTNSDIYNNLGTLINGDIVAVTLTSSDPCPTPPDTTDQLVITVDPILVPSILITAVPDTCICPGTQIDFTFDTTNAGTAPMYQWQLNGSDITGATGTTYSSSTWSNGDVIGVVLTSNALCVNPAIATHTVNICVLGVTAPTISVAPVAPVCDGTNIDFVASASDTGATPTYQWYLNGVMIAGATNSTYSNSSLDDGDELRCLVTSSIPCALPDTASNYTNVTILQITNPLVDATASTNGVCYGTPITWSAAPSGVISLPTYQWLINGNIIPGATDASYTQDPSTVVQDDVVSVILTSTDPCPVPPNTVDTVNMNIIPLVIPGIAISLLPAGPVCDGTPLDFTSVYNDEGTAPLYQWQVNGVNILGANSSTFSSTTLTDNDIITVILTSNAPCATPPVANSNQIVVQYIPYVTPEVSIVTSASDTICPLQPVTFTATPLFPGNNPLYDWYVNGVLVCDSCPYTYSTSNLGNGSVVGAFLTSNEICLTTPTANSNFIVHHWYPELAVVSDGAISICPGEAVTLLAEASAGSPAYIYNWSDGSTGDSIIVHPEVTGYYFVTATDNCPTHLAVDSELVEVRPEPNANFSWRPDDPSTLAPDVDFTNLATGYYQFQWSFGDGDTSTEINPVHIYPGPGAYPVTLWTINALGCLDSITYLVIVKEDIFVFIPNCFTPNGDLRNEYFTPIGESLDKYSFIIYNRWGTPIFHGDETTPWRGYPEGGGEPVPNDVYVYRVDLGSAKFNPRIVVGRVSVVR